MVIEIKNRKNIFVRSGNGILSGACEGIGKNMGIDPWLLRIALILSTLVFGTGVFLYAIISFTLPREDRMRLYDRQKFLGVCHRLSRRYGIDLGLIRTLFVLSAIASLGATLIAYIVFHIVIDNRVDKIYL